MICQKCGAELPDDSIFCSECGTRQEKGPEDNRQSETKVCPACGKLVPEDSVFCPNCGAKQEGVNALRRMQPKTVVQGQRRAPGRAPVTRPQPPELTPEEKERLKKRNQKIGIGAAAVVAVCLVIGVASALIKPSINLNRYLTVTAEGYDTVGSAVITFDTDQFEDDYGKKLSSKKSSRSKSDAEAAVRMFLNSCVSGSADVTDHLSNGDIVTYTWDCDDDYALENFGYKLKYTDIEYTVEGLKEAKTFDPFEGIEIRFEGISSKGSASIDGTPTERAAENFRYDLDNRNNLSNGDTVTITASVYYNDPIEYCIENYGMIPSSLIKEYTVEGLSSYVRTISEVSEESLARMQSQARDVYLAYAAKNWGEGEQLNSLDYIGNYLLVNKDSASYRGNENVLYLVFRQSIHNTYTNGGNTYDAVNNLYWYISFSNLLVDPDGVNTVNLSEYKTPGDRAEIDSGISSGWWSTKSWRYYGYQTLDDLKKAVVTTNMEAYNYEENIDSNLAPAEAASSGGTEGGIPAESEGADGGSTEEDVGETEENGSEEVSAVVFAAASDGMDGMIFPDSANTVISAADAAALSDEDLRYAINEIYARHGYIFKDDALRAYYQQYDWYQATVAPASFSDSVLTQAEKENIKILQKERDKR